MRLRRAGSSALSVFAGASVISAGVASALLAGTHVTQSAHTAAVTNACGQHPLTAAISSGAAQQIQFDSVSAARLATSAATSSATSTASNPGGTMATASATTTTASPTADASTSPADPATSSSPTPTATATGTGTPTPTPTVTAPPVRLCVSVQSLSAASGVRPGGTATYAVWVWPSGGTAKGITVTASAKVSAAVAPRFSVCPAASGATCAVGTLADGQADELQAVVTVPKTAKAGQHATLTATSKATGATSATPASASVLIAAKATPKPSASTSTGPTISSGVGTTLPTGVLPLPLTPAGVASSAALPILPNPTSDPGGLFPTVGPSATPSATAGTLPNARGVRVTDASNSFPLSTRLLGGQVLGLAVLAAALIIAIARLSLREPRAPQDKDSAP
jgi:hypothetical protein